MNTILKTGCITLYLLAAISLWVDLPWGSGPVVQTLALAFIAVHVLELLLAFKHVKAYQGSLGASILLTLLFGLLHWAPIARSQKKSAKADQALSRKAT